MRRLTLALVALAALFHVQQVSAAGTINIALAQQVDTNGRPLIGALLYTYVSGTVSQPQNTFQDFGLTIPNPWPLVADGTGRIPMFYLADGAVHVRLTTAGGVVVFDYPAMQVVGPSVGTSGTGPGTSVDATAIFSTGDVKWRPSGDNLFPGWVKLNGTTIGPPGSSATTTNAALQQLFQYLWQACDNNHCPMLPSGRGVSSLADWQAGNKQLTLPDLRGAGIFGLDNMGSGTLGRLLGANMIVGPLGAQAGDLPTTPFAIAGQNNQPIAGANLPSGVPLSLSVSMTDNRTWATTGQGTLGGGALSTGFAISAGASAPIAVAASSQTITGTATGNLNGGGAPLSVVPAMMLGTWYMKM